MIIRDARPSDFGDFIKMSDEIAMEIMSDDSFPEWAYLKRPSLAFRKKKFIEYLDDVRKGHNIFMVAEEKGRMIGYCRVRKVEVPDNELSHVGLLGIRVAKKYRGRGLGSALLSKAIAASRKKFDILNLFVVNRDPRPKKLYRRFGFRTWGIAPGFVKRKKKYMDLEYMYLRLK